MNFSIFIGLSFWLKKMMSTAEKATLQGERMTSVPPASFPGRPMSRFTHLRSSRVSSVTLNPLGVTLAPLQSTILPIVFTFS